MIPSTFPEMARDAREHLEAHHGREFPHFESYGSDNAFKEALAFQNDEWRRFANDQIDRGMAPSRQRQLARWAAEDAARINGGQSNG